MQIKTFLLNLCRISYVHHYIFRNLDLIQFLKLNNTKFIILINYKFLRHFFHISSNKINKMIKFFSDKIWFKFWIKVLQFRIFNNFDKCFNYISIFRLIFISLIFFNIVIEFIWLFIIQLFNKINVIFETFILNNKLLTLYLFF